MIIRPARPADYPVIAQLTVAAYQADGQLSGDNPYQAQLADVAGRAAAGELLVAEDQQRVLGSVLFVLPGSGYAEISGPGEAEFRMLAVAPDAQRRGVGEALALACLERARARGCRAVVICSRDTATAAHQLYQRLGFVRLPERDWAPLPGINLLALRRTLTDNVGGVTKGAGMAVDIGDQPDVYARLAEPAQADAIATVAARIADRRPRHVVLTARGTSDHAALYAAYLIEIRLGLPAALASPSAITLFGARPDLSQALVIGVSQSGSSPDLVEVLQVAREQGALTCAVTNNQESALVETAELAIDIAAGAERAVAATKTYTAELLALLMLVEGVRAGTGRLPAGERAALSVLPELAALTIADTAATELAERYRFAGRVVTTGRGYGYPTAREAALKLMETSYLAALAFSGADLLHGPLAMTDPDVPVLAVVGDGPGGAAMREVLARLGERRADVVVVGPTPVAGAAAQLRVPALEERHAPLLDILPLQQLALALALARGEDPDAPRGLRKVTATR